MKATPLVKLSKRDPPCLDPPCVGVGLCRKRSISASSREKRRAPPEG